MVKFLEGMATDEKTLNARKTIMIFRPFPIIHKFYIILDVSDRKSVKSA